jgi:diphthamide biosynthesis enzyme Dph1/Dph2-like protein
MKLLFVEARVKERISAENIESSIDNLVSSINPRVIGIAASVQYLGDIEKVAKALEKRGIKVQKLKGRKAYYICQIIGCDCDSISELKDIDAFLIISDGVFHSLQLAIKTEKPVFVLGNNGIKRIEESQIQSVRKKIKTASIKFLQSDVIGIISSSKPGQQHLAEAFKLKARLERKGKKAPIFLSDTINISELENFSPKAWVNTACEGISLDSNNILYYNEAIKLLAPESSQK